MYIDKQEENYIQLFTSTYTQKRKNNKNNIQKQNIMTPRDTS